MDKKLMNQEELLERLDDAQTTEEVMELMAEEHDEIVKALCERDTDRASRAIISHIENQQSSIIKSIRNGRNE